MDSSCSVRKFVLVKGGKICQIDLSPFLLFSNFGTFKRLIKFITLRVYTFFFHILKLEPLFYHIYKALFSNMTETFLVIRRSKTPVLHQKLCLFSAIKDYLLKMFDVKRADFAILESSYV